MLGRRGNEDRAWSIHLALLGTVALGAALVGHVVTDRPPARAADGSETVLQLLNGIGQGLQDLGVLVALFAAWAIYALVSTALVVRFRARARRLLRAHGLAVLTVVLVFGVGHLVELGEKTRRERALAVAKEQEKSANDERSRRCTRAEIQADRYVDPAQRDDERASVEVVVVLTCDGLSSMDWNVERVRILGAGADWTLSPSIHPVEGTKPWRVIKLGRLNMASALTNESFVVEMSLTDGKGWTAVPVSLGRVSTWP